MFLRLSDADRARFGIEEWIEFNLGSATMAEAEALEDAGGDWSIIFDTGNWKATRCRVWLALHRAGVKLTLADLDTVDIVQMVSADAVPGKPDAEAVTSAPAESPTSRTSATSTRRSPRKRSKPSA